MNSMSPDLSGLVPFMVAFFAIAAVSAVVCLAIIAHTAAAFVLAKRRTRAARPDSVLAQGQFDLRDRLQAREPADHAA